MSTNAEENQAPLRQGLIAKVEQSVTHRAVLDDRELILHFRILLQDLPFAGKPSLLTDEHRAAIDVLVDRASRKDLKIFSIIGHTSEPGTDAFNLDLSRDRANAVKAYLKLQVDQHSAFSDDSLYKNISVHWRGKREPRSDNVAEADNPLDRRVEISYRIRVQFPQPVGGVVPRSRFWKVDFAAGGGVGGVPLGVATVGVESGVGTLTMLPDTELGQNDTTSRTLTYESLGLSVGLTAALKNLKLVQRFPMVKRLLDALDDDLPGAATSAAYKRASDVLKASGFSLDLKSEGGQFYIDEPLSFDEMANFNFMVLAGNVSFGGSASGQLVVLHSGYFYAATVIYGGGMSIAIPDVGLNFAPIAWAQVGN